jgi:lipopolysaccharide export system permease protein
LADHARDAAPSPHGTERSNLMLGPTLTRHYGKTFTVTTLAIFFGMSLLILLIDYIELLRRTSNLNVSALFVAQTSIYRVPQITERLLASCVQTAAMVCYLGLARRLELVVARAAGISAWQFLMPAILAAFVLGAIATTAFNPLAANLQEKAKRIEASLFSQLPAGFNQASGFWIAQATAEGKALINAASSLDQGRRLTGVTVFRFGLDDRFIDRIEATEVTLEEGMWRLLDARISAFNTPPQVVATYEFKSNLNKSQVLESFATPDTVSFWQLPDYIASSQYSGTASAGYRLQYYKLIARPFMFAAVVLLAGAFSLKTARFGGIHIMVLSGVLAGFLLYVLAKVTEDLGTAELIPPLLAAWVPVVAATLVGAMGLLYQEDG